jgi:hypothetical protein
MSKLCCNYQILVLQPLDSLHVGSLRVHSVKSRPIGSGIVLIVGFDFSTVQ